MKCLCTRGYAASHLQSRLFLEQDVGFPMKIETEQEPILQHNKEQSLTEETNFKLTLISKHI